MSTLASRCPWRGHSFAGGRATGTKPLVYVAGSAYDEIVRDHFGGYDLWRRDVFLRPSGAGRSWRFWQYSNRGRVGGIAGYVDLNVFCCEEADLPLADRGPAVDRL